MMMIHHFEIGKHHRDETGKKFHKNSEKRKEVKNMENTKTIKWGQTDRLGCKRTDPRSWSDKFLNHYCMTADKVGGWIIEGSREGAYPCLGDFVRQMFWHYDDQIDADKLRVLSNELDERWNDLIISDNEEELTL